MKKGKILSLTFVLVLFASPFLWTTARAHPLNDTHSTSILFNDGNDDDLDSAGDCPHSDGDDDGEGADNRNDGEDRDSDDDKDDEDGIARSGGNFIIAAGIAGVALIALVLFSQSASFLKKRISSLKGKQ